MILGNNFIFLRLQKSASTHITKILDNLFNVRNYGKHNTLNKLTDKYVFGTIRNPYSWYISLWATGCESFEFIYNDIRFNEFNRRNLIPEYCKDLNVHKVNKIIKNCIALIKVKRLWRYLYSDINNENLFRKWLKYIFSIRKDILYELDSDIKIGFYTYIYSKLYLYNFIENINKVNSIEDLIRYDNFYNLMDFTIKTENLENELILFLNDITSINDKEKEYILSMKNNKSNTTKHKPYEEYYDEKSIKLIEEYESFILNKYNYVFGD
ncbi:MAG: hypothetical protein R6U96_06380 [Promethearchaeia archaeon]